MLEIISLDNNIEAKINYKLFFSRTYLHLLSN